jgi:tRNA(fMet)-specific endonuclease VapC
MIILDTDHMSLLQRGNAEGQRIRLRLLAVPRDDVAATIISYEEQMRGWLARIGRFTTLERQVSDYGEVKKMLRNYCSIAVIDFGNEASAEFQRLLTSKIRVGTMDLKIAAIVIANGATLLTRNRIHFDKVPGLHTEDWSL